MATAPAMADSSSIRSLIPAGAMILGGVGAALPLSVVSKPAQTIFRAGGAPGASEPT